jgi:hypothetical protein
MNLQLADKLLAKTRELEATINEINSEIKDVVPDLHSQIEAQKNLIGMLSGVALLRDDIQRFRDGKGILDPKKLLMNKIEEKMRRSQGEDNGNGGLGGFNFGDGGPFGGGNPFGGIM